MMQYAVLQERKSRITSMEDIKIRKTAVEDLSELQKIGRITFSETFSQSNTAEDMVQYLEKGFSEAQLLEELRNQESEFYFAVDGENVVGYLKLNFGNSQTELQDKAALEIERIYVLGDYQGKKVGQLLYEKALEVAYKRHVSYIWLGVWEENPRAIAFYTKNGFTAFGKHVFKLGNDEQTDIMMRKTLDKKKLQFPIDVILENDLAVLYPLCEKDFEELYRVASDPEVWQQHPNKDRWKKEVFRTFFDGALQSGGAFKVTDRITGETTGSTRFYNYDETQKSIFIGYTFYGTKSWGTGLNQTVKKLMLDYIFEFVSAVYFHIGAQNIRSQMAIMRLGAKKTAEEEVAYFGEPSRWNFVYRILKEEWEEL